MERVTGWKNHFGLWEPFSVWQLLWRPSPRSHVTSGLSNEVPIWTWDSVGCKIENLPGPICSTTTARQILATVKMAPLGSVNLQGGILISAAPFEYKINPGQRCINANVAGNRQCDLFTRDHAISQVHIFFLLLKKLYISTDSDHDKFDRTVGLMIVESPPTPGAYERVSLQAYPKRSILHDVVGLEFETFFVV